MTDVFDYNRREWVEMSAEQIAAMTEVPARRYSADFQRVRVTGKPMMSEEEIAAAEREEWLGVLVSLWDAVGKEVDERRILLYAEQLGWLPYALLKAAVHRAIMNNGAWQTVPTVSAIYAELRKELHNPYDLREAVERWQAAQFSALNLLGGDKREEQDEEQAYEIENTFAQSAVYSA